MATTSAGFDDIEALGSAWHTVAGYPTHVFSFAEVVALLDHNQDFAWRCCNTDPAFFFGPQKEILWEVVDLEYRRPPLLRQRAADVLHAHQGQDARGSDKLRIIGVNCTPATRSFCERRL